MARRKRPRGRKVQTGAQIRRCAEDHVRELEALPGPHTTRESIEISKAVAFWIQQIIASENKLEKDAKYQEMEAKLRELEKARGSDFLVPRGNVPYPYAPAAPVIAL